MDANGNPTSGDTTTVALVDRAVDRLLRFHPDVIELAGTLAQPAAAIPMASAFVAYLNLTSTDPADLPAARDAHARLVAAPLNAREALHARAIGAWLDGEWGQAAQALDDVLERWPADTLALQIGHQLDFFCGDATRLRDRPARTRRELPPDHPHTGFVLGMMAFGLEESGHYGQALDTGQAAVDTNADDVWGLHAVVHTYEMQGRVADGVRTMVDGPAQWTTDNLFTVHNWWHLTLFELELGDIDAVLRIYDEHLRGAGAADVPIELLDASALLWRLHLDGVDVTDRAATLADGWARWLDEPPWYVFNDLHAVMALVLAGRGAAARAHVARLEAAIAAAGTNAAMTREIGLPACRAVMAFADSRYDDVVRELMPIRRRLHCFGGSHAQRDAVARTLLEAALRSGRFELARTLTSERLAVRESNVYAWQRRAIALRGLGLDVAADDATRIADDHRRTMRAG